MYIADMHCDSLSLVTADRGLRTRYNLSLDHPQLQVFAAFDKYTTEPAELRRRRLMHTLDIYISERARLDFVPVYDCRDIDFALATERNSSIFAVEGGGGLTADCDELRSLYNGGLRLLGLAWGSNELATASGDTSGVGLTEQGRALALRASEMGIILDLSHLSDRAAEELLELTPYPVVATHSNFRELADTPRNLPLSIARKIASRGGVIGLSLYPRHLTAADTATLDDLRRHVDFALEHLGEGSIGFGFDIDGTSGAYPAGLDESDSIHDRVLDYLSRYYSAPTLERLSGTNVIDFFKSNL